MKMSGNLALFRLIFTLIRYTSAAIFKERYKGQTSPLSSSLDIVVTDTTEASVNSDILVNIISHKFFLSLSAVKF